MRAEIDNQRDSDQKEKLQSIYNQYYMDVMLPNVTPPLVSTREAMCSILCPTMDDTKIHWLQCACGHCDHCPKGKIPTAEEFADAAAPEITFHTYRPVTRHSQVDGALPSHVTKCPYCEHPEYKEKKGTISTKTKLLKFTISIRLFMREHFMNTLVDYAHHYTLVKLLSKGPGSCGEMQMKRFLDSKKDGSCITEIRDFAEQVDIVMADAIQADHFGWKRNLSIEGCSLKYYDRKKRENCKDNPALWSALKHEHEYHCHFSDKSTQDAATVFAHECSMLTKLQAQGVLSMVEGEGPEKEQTIVTCLNGCAKQYHSSTSLYLMSQLVQ
jgi:hypothetical protein